MSTSDIRYLIDPPSACVLPNDVQCVKCNKVYKDSSAMAYKHRGYNAGYPHYSGMCKSCAVPDMMVNYYRWC